LSPRSIDAAQAHSIGELQGMIRKKAQQLGKGEWITGYGWAEANLAEKRNVLRADLDAASPDNPVALIRASGHSIVGNSKALALAGIDRKTPKPLRGVIERNAQGEPNGIIRERNDLYVHLVPPDSFATLRTAPKFDAPEGRYAWLSRFVFVGVAEKTPTGNAIAYFKAV
jgi:predicted amidohydrolase YtcJ